MQKCKNGLAICLGERQRQNKDQADPDKSCGWEQLCSLGLLPSLYLVITSPLARCYEDGSRSPSLMQHPVVGQRKCRPRAGALDPSQALVVGGSVFDCAWLERECLLAGQVAAS